MGEKNGTCAAVRLKEGVRLIWGPLNTGLTVGTVERHVVFPGTPEHRGTPQNPVNPQENPEHLPENTEHPPENEEDLRMCLYNTQKISTHRSKKPAADEEEEASKSYPNFIIFTISKIVTSALHSHILIFCGHIYVNKQIRKTEVERGKDRLSPVSL